MLGMVKNYRWLPTALRREIRVRLVRPFVRQDYDAISIHERDWDNLVILDGCLYDTFEELNPFDAPVENVYSNASHTKEFLKKNFSEEHRDTVYVTSNPWVKEYDDRFAHVEHVWDEWWDEENETVLPENVTDVALETADQYPHKRLIIHYMQPHYPFIGPTSEQIRDQSSYLSWWGRDHASVWELLSAGKIDKETARQAYAENLELAFPSLQRLTDQLKGKTVVTSDHGNLFGERVSTLPIKIYGHPPYIPDKNLVSVPWLELPHDERRIIKETTSQSASPQEIESNVEARLRSLGYT